MDYENTKRKIINYLKGKKTADINFPEIRKILDTDPRTVKLYILNMIKENIIICRTIGPVTILKLNEDYKEEQ